MNGLIILQDFIFGIIVFTLGIYLGRLFIIYYTNYKKVISAKVKKNINHHNVKVPNYSINGITFNIINIKGLNELSKELTDITSKEFNLSKGLEYNGINTLYSSLLSYLLFECYDEDKNFSAVTQMIDLIEYTSYDESFQNPIDMLFEDLKKREPDHFAVRHYNAFLKLNINKRYEIIYMIYFTLNKMLNEIGVVGISFSKRNFEEVEVDNYNLVDLDSVDILDNKPTLTQEAIEQAKELVTVQGMDLELLSPELQDNEEVVLTAINSRGWSLKYASDRLKDDKDVVLVAVSKWGYALAFASDRLRDDKDVVMKALEHNGYALAYASPRLRDNGVIVQHALNEKGRALRFASRRLRSNKNIINFALIKSKRAKDFILDND